MAEKYLVVSSRTALREELQKIVLEKTVPLATDVG